MHLKLNALAQATPQSEWPQPDWPQPEWPQPDWPEEWPQPEWPPAPTGVFSCVICLPGHFKPSPNKCTYSQVLEATTHCVYCVCVVFV